MAFCGLDTSHSIYHNLTSLNETTLCVFIKTFILASMKRCHPSNVLKLCSHWQRQNGKQFNLSFFKYFLTEAKIVSVCACVNGSLLAMAQRINDYKDGECRGDRSTNGLPLRSHMPLTHISLRPIPTLQPSTL